MAGDYFFLEVEPDQRAGTVSKTDRSTSWDGEHDLRLPPLQAGLAEQPCTRLVNEIRPGHSPSHRPPLFPSAASPVVGSTSSLVAQPAERPTLNREVDGANPSGAATSSPHRAASRAGRSIRRSPHRHCGGRRGRTVPAHHFLKAPVAQCIEHRASNAEVAGEIPAGSTTHHSPA